MSHLGQQESKTSVEKGEVEVIEEEGTPNLSKLEFSTENKEYLRLLSYQEENAGRLVFDPQAAYLEFGQETASQLKLSPDGTKVLWPQPTDDPEDPQNWNNPRKNRMLVIATLAAVIPDFESSIGIAAVFALARQFHTDPNTINQLGFSWNVFLVGWGGLIYIMLLRRYGRLPVLFWSQGGILALATQLGVTFAQDLATSSVMRDVNGLVGTCSQVAGLYVITDMYPAHLQGRKISIWAMGFVLSPLIAPFLFGFLVAHASWRWAYGIGAFYNLFVVLLISFLMDETIYDRRLPNPRYIPTNSRFLERMKVLFGITGFRRARYRETWTRVIIAPLNVAWRPHLFFILLFEGVLFGFSIGFHSTNTVLLADSPPNGYGFDQIQIAATYASSIVGVLVGEVVGRYLNDWILEFAVRKNKGIFEAECRLWACYAAVPLYVVGFVLQGAAFHKHLSVAVLTVGWVCAQCAVMMNTSAVYAYCNDCFPKYQGEISALLNLARSLGGFSIAYFQIAWVTKHGALQTFGCEAGIVAGLFVLIVPVLQIKGKCLRGRFST